MRKGFNQIDLVFSVVMVIFIVFFSMYYSSHFIGSSIEDSKSTELKKISTELFDSIFLDEGHTSNWHWSGEIVKPGLASYIYRVPVHLSEWNSTDNNGVFAWVFIEPEWNAYNSSIIVYDGNETLDTYLSDMVQDSYGFVEEVNVSFNVSVPADGEKIVYVYYSKENRTSVQYTTITEGNNTLNVTKVSPEKRVGVSLSKMISLDDMDISNSSSKLGISLPFKISFETDSRYWVYGYNRTGKNVAVNRKKVLYQNSTGHMEIGDAIAYVWR